MAPITAFDTLQRNVTSLPPTLPFNIQPASSSQSASEAIQTITFGVLGILFAVASIFLAYRQLQHMHSTSAITRTSTELSTQSSMTMHRKLPVGTREALTANIDRPSSLTQEYAVSPEGLSDPPPPYENVDYRNTEG